MNMIKIEKTNTIFAYYKKCLKIKISRHLILLQKLY